MENFVSGMVRFESIWVSGPLSGEHISDFGSGMSPDRLVQISGLESVLSCLLIGAINWSIEAPWRVDCIINYIRALVGR